MAGQLILASASPTRAALLSAAGVPFQVAPVRLDEAGMRAALAAEGAGARDIADTLAEAKARRAADSAGAALVVGADQVLEHRGAVLGKAADGVALRAQLQTLRGDRHSLLSAAVVYEDGRPVWRHVGVARLVMRPFSDGYLDAYLARNGDDLLGSVGGYRIEGEGVRLFHRIEGDHFTILGLPLLELLAYLTLRGVIEG